MKTTSNVRGIVLRIFLASAIFGAISTAAFSAGEWAELTDLRDSNTRVWSVSRQVSRTLPSGREEVATVSTRVIEKGSGICYRGDHGKFAPSNPHWEPTPGGFVLRECAYGLSAGKTLAEPILYTTGGSELRFRPAFLKVSNGLLEEIVAEVDTSVPGVVDAEDPRRLIFTGAFGALGDLEILAEKGALHQNLILKKLPALGADWKAQEAKLSLYTELDLDEFLKDDSACVRFGSELISGAAATLAAQASRTAPITFYKTCLDAKGGSKEALQHFFAESPVYSAAGGKAATLVRERAERRLFRHPQTNATYLVEGVPLDFLENADYPVVWDFESVSGNYEPEEPWIPANTYWVTADLYVSPGTLQILPGTVVKLNPYVTIYAAAGGTIVAQGEPYDYIVFTKARDDNCGEIIPGALDMPYMCAFYLMDGSTEQSVIQYCKIGHAFFGISCLRSLQAPIAHNIIRGGNILWIGIIVQFGANTSCFNNLVTDSTWLGIQYYQGQAVGEAKGITNNTVDGANVGIQLQYSTCGRVGENLLTNCRIAGISASSTTINTLDHNGYWKCVTPVAGAPIGPNSVDLGQDENCKPYDTSSVGDYFLNDDPNGGGRLRDWWPIGDPWTAEDAGLAGKEFTVDKPELAPASVTWNQYWPRVGSDMDIVDIGYHHNRVDVVVDGCDTLVTNCGLIVTPGLVLAMNGVGRTLRIGAEGKLICVGDPHANERNVFASKRSVSMAIESSLKLHPAGFENDLQVGLTLSADSIFDSRIRNTDFRGLYKGIEAERWCVFPVKNCRFDKNMIGLESSGGGVSAVNNVFAWNEKGLSAALPQGAETEFRNNTFDGNWDTALDVSADPGSTAVVKDNLFTYNESGISVTGGGEARCAHNGFYGNEEPGPNDPEKGDQLLDASPYHREGALTKRWYLGQNCPLIDAGSRSTQSAKMLPYTSAYDESYDVGAVDIGSHAFTATGSANPDPGAPTLTITQLEDEGGRVPPSRLAYTVDITVQTDSTEIAQLYVDGEFVGTVSPVGEEDETIVDVFGFASDTVLNGAHTAQALGQSAKPATGCSQPFAFETLNRCDCLSLSSAELDLSGSRNLEISCMLAYPYENRVVVTTLVPGWEALFPSDPQQEPIDPTSPFNWDQGGVKTLGGRPPAFVVHEAWDGTNSQGQQVYDGLYRLEIHLKVVPWAWWFTSMPPVSAFSTPIAEAEVAIFLPDFWLWDTVSTQAVVNACWNLSLPYRVVVDQGANWDNLKTFLTAPRPTGRYPSILYISCHGNNKLEIDEQEYTLTRFWLSDGPVYATSSPPEGNLAKSYVEKHHFISDPAYEKYGLKDPRYLDEQGNPLYELSQTGWVKFVWIDACYSNVAPGYQDMNDMARAFGMDSDNNWVGDADQSYIGFSGPTPNGFHDQWISVVYTWAFWYYLSAWDGAAPAYPVEQVWANLVPTQVTFWALSGYPWALLLEYMLAISDISYPSWDAKLKDHR